MCATTATDAQERDLDPEDFEDDGQDELLKASPALKIVTSLGIIAAGYNLTLLVIWVAATLPLRLPVLAQRLLEAVAAATLADVNSGTFHFTFDHADAGDRLRDVMPTSVQAARAAEASPQFATATLWEKFVWKFQIHHSLPWPRAVTKRSSSQKQLDALGTLGSTAALLAWMAGLMEPWLCRVVALSWIITAQAQRTHFWCHERNHSPHTLPVVVRWAQDAGLLLHPDLHRVHHERYECNFPILTGWTNRYVQFLYEASVRCGLVDTGLGQKPTTIGPTKGPG